MTYYHLRQWPVVTKCPPNLKAIASSLLQAHVLIRKTGEGVSRDVLWKRPQPQIYSIGNVLMHIRGTEHEWISHRLGGRPLVRNRDEEFSAQDGPDARDLLERIAEQEAATLSVLGGLREEDLTGEYGGCSAEFILHYTAQHLAYHAGQLLMLRRLFEPGFEL